MNPLHPVIASLLCLALPCSQAAVLYTFSYRYTHLNTLQQKQIINQNQQTLLQQQVWVNKAGLPITQHSQMLTTTGQVTVTQSNTFDAMGRIHTVTQNGQQTQYQFDLANNLRTLTNHQGVLTNTYNARNQLTQQTGAQSNRTLSYSLAGNMIQLGQQHYHYNALNQLVTATTAPDKTSLYAYLPTGELLSQTTPNGQSAVYFYSQGVLTNGLSNDTMSSYLLSTHRLARFYQGQVTFLFYNSHGDVIGQGQASNIDAYAHYLPYGAHNTSLSHSPSSVTNSTLLSNNPFGWSSSFRLTNGLYAMGAGTRIYNPTTAQFMQQDYPFHLAQAQLPGSVTQPLTLNRYGIDGDNPLTHNDPSGHEFGAAIALQVIEGLLTIFGGQEEAVPEELAADITIDTETSTATISGDTAQAFTQMLDDEEPASTEEENGKHKLLAQYKQTLKNMVTERAKKGLLQDTVRIDLTNSLSDDDKQFLKELQDRLSSNDKSTSGNADDSTDNANNNHDNNADPTSGNTPATQDTESTGSAIVKHVLFIGGITGANIGMQKLIESKHQEKLIEDNPQEYTAIPTYELPSQSGRLPYSESEFG